MMQALLWGLPTICAWASASESIAGFGASQQFSVAQVAVGRVVQNVPAIIKADLARYGVVSAPIPVSNVAIQGTSITASPSDTFDSLYMCSVDVGGQIMALHLDTGSSDL